VKSLLEEISTHPKVFGEQLRKLREAAGLSLEEVTSETKISRRLLESLEAGRFHFLPEKVFSRNFVRQYVRMVGGDEDALVRAFNSVWDRFEIASGTHPYTLEAETPQPIIRWHFWAPMILTVVLFLVVSVVILQGPGRREEVLPLEPRRALAAEPERAPTQVASLMQEGGTGQDESGDPVVKMLVQVDEGQECWIKYRDREGRVGQEIIQGSSLALELMGPVLLTLGNAGVVRLQVGDQSYENLGRPGQVIHTQVSHDGLIDRVTR